MFFTSDYFRLPFNYTPTSFKFQHGNTSCKCQVKVGRDLKNRHNAQNGNYNSVRDLQADKDFSHLSPLEKEIFRLNS